MHLTLFTPGNCLDKKTWSGTCLALYNSFSKNEGVEIDPINMYGLIPKPLKGLQKIYGKLFFVGGNHTRNRIIYPTMAKRITKIIESSNSDWHLFIADHACVPDIPKDKKCAVYIDSEYMVWAPNVKGRCKDFYVNYYDKKTQESLERMDLIFTMNEWTKEALVELRNIDPSKIHNIGFGINVKPFYGTKDYTKNLLLIVLRKGTEEYKGLNLLLDSIPLVRKEVPNVRLAIVGSDVGTGFEGIENYYNYPREKTVELFQQATLYVMPSKGEPNGITYLEALANKAPIIGMNRFAVPEFSGQGKWGFLVGKDDPYEVSEAVIHALSNKEKLEAMGKAGQEYVIKRFSWDTVAEQMCRIMNEYDK